MKILKNTCKKYWLSLLTLILMAISVTAGCADKSDVSDEIEPADAVAIAENDFDPLDDSRDRKVIEVSKTKKPEADDGLPDDEEDFNWARVDSFLKAQDLVDSSLTVYRVQLYASQYYTEANYELQIAREIFEDTVMIKYDLPYYKVLLGNTTEEKLGRRLLYNARSLGYSNSWLIESAPDSIYYRILFVKDSIAVADSLQDVNQSLDGNQR
jgi:hypothetical protein